MVIVRSLPNGRGTKETIRSVRAAKEAGTFEYHPVKSADVDRLCFNDGYVHNQVYELKA